jgi:nickel-dependent lactate racemase
MKRVPIKFGPDRLELRLPDTVDVLSTVPPCPIENPVKDIENALTHSIGTPSFEDVVSRKLKKKPDSRVVVVISDHTRPVPYKGDQGILWPILQKILGLGVPRERALILVAPGTHHPLTAEELRDMLDPRILTSGIEIKNHDCRKRDSLVYLGRTSRNSEVYINRDYMDADIKVLTGLVESHFIAGVSGGRKSICPGLVGEETTYVFHSAEMLAAKEARDLNLVGNPAHEEAVEVAKMAGVDYIVNVTLDMNYRLTGVFAGDLGQAHARAVEHLKTYVSIPLGRQYDMIITHGGFVGINHYQAVKAGLAALPALRDGGTLVMVAANTDIDPVGTQRYKTVLNLMKLIGPGNFIKLIFSPEWRFVPDQWEVEAWSNLFMKIPPDNFIYYSPHMAEHHYEIIPGVDGNTFLPEHRRYKFELDNVQRVIDGALAKKAAKSPGKPRPLTAFMADGPYGIVSPVPQEILPV